MEEHLVRGGAVREEELEKDLGEKYFREYGELLKEVREETRKNFPKEYDALLSSIADSLELVPKGKVEREQIPHSISGILRLHLWKLVNWIGYEIIHGKYFEAMRDTRFLFEGCIWSVIMEDAIENPIYNRYGSLSTIGLKIELLSLWRKAKEKEIYKIRCITERKKETTKLVNEYLASKNIREMPMQEVKGYLEDYIEILSDERLGYSTLKLIKEVIAELEEYFGFKLSDKKKKKFIRIWKSLCDYTHFTQSFFKNIVNDPDFVFVEKFNQSLFNKCFKFYLDILDLFYSVVLWRWGLIPQTRKTIKKIISNYPENFFNLTLTILDSVSFI